MQKIILPLLILALLGSGAWMLFGRGQPASSPAAPTALSAGATPAPAVVVADARVLPLADVALSFERAGTVAQLLVAEGDAVTIGQPLAQLDSGDLELKVAQAEVGLARAQTRYDQIAAGAPPETVAVAEAGINQAEAQAAQARATVSSADIGAAQAQLADARAALASVLDGPKGTEVTQAQATLDQANTSMAQQRDALSAAKTNAQLAVDQSANALRDRQADYSRIYWENQELRDKTGDDDMPQERRDAETTALHAVENAEAAMQQAQVAYEQARQAEIDGIAGAEARVRDAQARLDQLIAPADADKVAAAQARVAAAEANLARLRGPARSTQLEVAAAGVAQAQAARAQAAAPPREVDLAAAQVEIAAAKVALQQAELELTKATLRAPIAGIVAQLDLAVGEVAGPGSPSIILADLSDWKIETDDLTELDVVKLREGDSVAVGFDALPGVSLPGTITQIKPIGGSRQGDIVYTVVVQLQKKDERLRWNMTAVITTE